MNSYYFMWRAKGADLIIRRREDKGGREREDHSEVRVETTLKVIYIMHDILQKHRLILKLREESRWSHLWLTLTLAA